MLISIVCLPLAIGCAGGQHEVETPSDEVEAQPEVDPPVEDMTGALNREDMLAVLGRSVGDFLRRVHVEVETNEGEGYVGWRITHLPETSPSWLDIRVGDVVTSVNGLPIEQPNEAQQVFEILRVASEVRIELIRNGEHRALRVPVQDTTPPAAEEQGTETDERRGPEQKSVQ